MKRDGGPAFPCEKKYQEFTRQETPIGFPGMTLRDYFAGQALAGLLAGRCWETVTCYAKDNPEVTAYSIADEMLAERERE